MTLGDEEGGNGMERWCGKQVLQAIFVKKTRENQNGSGFRSRSARTRQEKSARAPFFCGFLKNEDA